MRLHRLLSVLLAAAFALAACSSPTPAPTAVVAPTTPPTAVTPPTAEAGLPYPHTACAAGVNLTGQTINLYHVINHEE